MFPGLMLWLNKFDIPGTVFIGKFFFLPNNDLDMVAIIGKPFALPKIENPTAEDVDKYHALYIEKLQALFNKYKGKYAVDKENAVLEIL